MSRAAARPLAAVLLAAACTSCSLLARRLPVDAGFWFEPLTFQSVELGGSLTAEEIKRIESVARSELAEAFRGLAVTLSDRRDARYTVRVTQEIRDLRFKRSVGVAGQSRAIAGFGGAGAVSFYFLASSAMAYAPAGADRATLVEAIGRGVGRTAVHEFAHQLLPTAPIHDSADEDSYEFRFATRRAQFFGPMHWDLARPLLQQRMADR